jgi:hypothetical protein
MVDHVWTREHFWLTVSKVWPRSFAWLCTLWQSRREFYKEQTLFKSQVMKMCVTCSNRAHKSELGLLPTLNHFKAPFSVSSILASRVLEFLLRNLNGSKYESWSLYDVEEHARRWHQLQLILTPILDCCSLLSNHWHWQLWSHVSPKPEP